MRMVSNKVRVSPKCSFQLTTLLDMTGRSILYIQIIKNLKHIHIPTVHWDIKHKLPTGISHKDYTYNPPFQIVQNNNIIYGHFHILI